MTVPKVVDHVERRKQIARALWAVVARAGFEAASARAIAAEGGWSLGALRHYFDSQDELVEFAAWELIDGAGARVETIYATMPPGRTRCLRALEQLLPLDEIREGEVRAWVANLGDRLRSLPIPPEFAATLAKASVELHVAIGGLCLHLVASPRLMSAADAVRALKHHLSRIEARDAIPMLGR